MHNMHETKRRRAKVDAENGRTRDSIFRAAISTASNECISWMWAGAALFELWGGSSCSRRAFCGSKMARVAPVEDSANLGQPRAAHIENCAAPRQTRSALFEYSAVLGRARAAISSQLRLWGQTEQPFRAICGSWARLQRPNEAIKDIS